MVLPLLLLIVPFILLFLGVTLFATVIHILSIIIVFVLYIPLFMFLKGMTDKLDMDENSGLVVSTALTLIILVLLYQSLWALIIGSIMIFTGIAIMRFIFGSGFIDTFKQFKSGGKRK